VASQAKGPEFKLQNHPKKKTDCSLGKTAKIYFCLGTYNSLENYTKNINRWQFLKYCFSVMPMLNQTFLEKNWTSSFSFKQSQINRKVSRMEHFSLNHLRIKCWSTDPSKIHTIVCFLQSKHLTSFQCYRKIEKLTLMPYPLTPTLQLSLPNM
jgi:hypothetical protein